MQKIVKILLTFDQILTKFEFVSEVDLFLHSTVPNPTGISLAVPDLPLSLFYRGESLGTTHSVPGLKRFDCRATESFGSLND